VATGSGNTIPKVRVVALTWRNASKVPARHTFLMTYGDLMRWMYRGGRPNRIAAALNRLSAVLHSAGIWPQRLATLELRGRRSGNLRSFPVVIAEYNGERFLVAMLGEHANWVANLRAAGGLAVLRHGRREPVRLEEVDRRTTAPILRKYLQVAPGARPHMPVSAKAPLADFERIAADYPVFRITPA
jgi:deazaflavin-dependent oxidoreductase (nitroreductase family)